MKNALWLVFTRNVRILNGAFNAFIKNKKGRARKKMDKDFKKYLENVIDLEKNAYLQNQVLNDLNYRIKRLGNYSNITKTETSSHAEFIEHVIYPGGLFVVGGAIIFGIKGLFNGFISGAIGGIFKGGLIGLVIANIIALIMFLIEKAKVDKEQGEYDQIYNQKKAADAKRVAEERKIKARLETQRDKLAEQHDDTLSTLRKFYNAGPIYSKYHNINAICSFYEYFMSGRCTELQGHEGAYNIYESEVRMDRIICKLDDVLANLEQIRDNQYMLYSAISEGNRKIDNLIEETQRQTSALNYLGEQTAIVAYNTEQTRQEAAQIKWLKTYELVQKDRHNSW